MSDSALDILDRTYKRPSYTKEQQLEMFNNLRELSIDMWESILQCPTLTDIALKDLKVSSLKRDRNMATELHDLDSHKNTRDIVLQQLTEDSSGRVSRVMDKYIRLRNKIAHFHVPMVKFYAAQYARKTKYMSILVEDLVQEGGIGLLKAVELYQVGKVPFSTFAPWWIKHRIRRYLGNSSRTIKVPVNVTKVMRQLRQRQQEGQDLIEVLHQNPDLEDSIEMEDVLRYCAVYTGYSLDEKIIDSGDFETTKVNMLVSESPTPYEALCKDRANKLLESMLSDLTPQEEDIIRMRFGMKKTDDEYDVRYSSQQVGKMHNIHYRTAQTIERRALKKLKKSAKDRGYTNFLAC